ncbi:putative transcription factor C2H2 family [Helianthus annuus]|nr:putative transcription factor C2H2 family [Helianthus annuus]
MATVPPPPPPQFFFVSTPTTTTTTNTGIPQPYNNGVPASNPHHSSSSSPTTSAIIVMIIISSAIIITATIYLLIRFFRTTVITSSSDVVLSNTNDNDNEHVHHHVISVTNSGNEFESLSLPLFTFSSLTGKINGGDCAVCLSKFDGEDQLRLLPLCCHAFHAQCIDSWLKSNLTCPLCRSTVNPSEADILNKIAADAGGGRGGTATGTRSSSFRIEIGTVSQRRDPAESDRRSYSVGSFEYIIDDGYEIPVESTHRNAVSDSTSVDKDLTSPVTETAVNSGGESGRRNWLREYVDRLSVSLSSRSLSFRSSGRFFTGSSRRSETVVDDYEATHGRIGEEISEYFRWLTGV